MSRPGIRIVSQTTENPRTGSNSKRAVTAGQRGATELANRTSARRVDSTVKWLILCLRVNPQARQVAVVTLSRGRPQSFRHAAITDPMIEMLPAPGAPIPDSGLSSNDPGLHSVPCRSESIHLLRIHQRYRVIYFPQWW